MTGNLDASKEDNMEETDKPLTAEQVRQRRALRLEFTAGLIVGIAEGVFFCWLASVI